MNYDLHILKRLFKYSNYSDSEGSESENQKHNMLRCLCTLFIKKNNISNIRRIKTYSFKKYNSYRY